MNTERNILDASLAFREVILYAAFEASSTLFPEKSGETY